MKAPAAQNWAAGAGNVAPDVLSDPTHTGLPLGVGDVSRLSMVSSQVAIDYLLLGATQQLYWVCGSSTPVCGLV
jgi:hypothetical protein